MLNTCYNSLSTCYLCHSFYTCLLSDSWVEEGEEGMLAVRLKADAGLWCLCCASPTHEQQHRNWQHPGSAPTPLSYFFLYADLRDTEHSQLWKNTLFSLFKMTKNFMELFSLPLSITAAIKDIVDHCSWRTAKMKQCHAYINFSEKTSSVQLSISTLGLFLVQLRLLNYCWGHDWRFYSSQE